jgi:hypothetical protein
MRLAHEWPRLEAMANTKRVAHLPVREALALLAEQTGDDEGDEVAVADSWRVFKTLCDVFNALCDEADADEALYAGLKARLDDIEAGPVPNRKAERVARIREAETLMSEALRLHDRAGQRRLRAERELGKLLNQVSAEGWTWPRHVLEKGDEAFGYFLDLCEGAVDEGCRLPT